MTRVSSHTIFPPPLHPGDRVAVCAPSGVPPSDQFEAGMAILAARYQVVDCGGVVLQREGGSLPLAPPRTPPRSGEQSPPSLAVHMEALDSSQDMRRREALVRALVTEDVRAVFCARGGYGLLRVVKDIPQGPPRIVVGFSDITVLHALLWQRGLVSVHGPVVTQLPRLSTEDLEFLFSLLENPAPPPPITGLSMLAPGKASGPLVGGNLTVLSHLVGAPAMPTLHGAILFLEDVNEREPYRIDRCLTQLRLCGALQSVAGIVCGDFTDCGDATAIERVLSERLGSLGIPVACGLPCGHGQRNRALPHGAIVELNAQLGTLTFRQGAVEAGC